MSIKNGHDVAGVRAAGCRQRLTACSRCEFVMVRVRRVESIKARTSTERMRDLRKRKRGSSTQQGFIAVKHPKLSSLSQRSQRLMPEEEARPQHREQPETDDEVQRQLRDDPGHNKYVEMVAMGYQPRRPSS